MEGGTSGGRLGFRLESGEKERTERERESYERKWRRRREQQHPKDISGLWREHFVLSIAHSTLFNLSARVI